MYNQEVYSPQGTINESNQKKFQQQLLSFINNTKNRDILVDFQQVEFVDGSGLVALVNAYNEAKNQSKNFYLFNVSPSVKMIFEISQLDKVLGIREFNYDRITDNDPLAA
ncbi:STAS domain-containing protein [Geminocystis sp. NIES-3709]|uniref:STAS domain-containing protein n=1 Tax=Geminocystis sp. NIES-3709 TaxID=1617448 RepID=UPI0005FCBAD9|nr:STAS domain-containing protein [Geminocystis sp. NIES-3709]BAQ65882.1 anti-sigma F factor antagonist SpoIIAA-2 [Geminocystis sp. NIES-3709]